MIASDGKTVFKIHRHCKLFFLDRAEVTKASAVANSDAIIATDVAAKDTELVTSSAPQKSGSLELWHQIMGHCNKEDVLKQEKVVKGMKITGKKTDLHCEPCIRGKQVQYFNRLPDEKAKSPMEFVHSDVAGPITPVAREGFRYAISFVDDFSGATFVYFLKKKAEATKALMKFLADSAPYGKIKHMRADGGGEFISEEFKKILIFGPVERKIVISYVSVSK